jgi:hypothetical protein
MLNNKYPDEPTDAEMIQWADEMMQLDKEAAIRIRDMHYSREFSCDVKSEEIDALYDRLLICPTDIEASVYCQLCNLRDELEANSPPNPLRTKYE